MNFGDRLHEEFFGLHDVAERKEPLTKKTCRSFSCNQPSLSSLASKDSRLAENFMPISHLRPGLSFAKDVQGETRAE
jgi:hypothetical protein